MSAAIPTTCPLCEANCGLLVELDRSSGSERIGSVRGDPEDPLSRGYLCPKGASIADIQHDPDRLRRPLRREGGRFVEIGWEQALGEIGARVVELQREHGRDSIALYYGNPTAHNYSASLYVMLLKAVLGSKNIISPHSIDALPRLLVSLWMYGSQAILPVPDLDRTRFLLILGANPVVSNGSIMTAPDIRNRLRAIRKAGGRIVLVDPRRTETAAFADQHHFIRPGTDAALLLAMLHTLVLEKRLRPSSLVLAEEVARLRELVAAFSPARVSAYVGIPAASIEQLARDFAAAPAAVCYGRLGTCTQRFGTLSTWLCDVLNAVTGNLDRQGGAMFAQAPVDLPVLARRIRQEGHHGTYRSRVGGYPEFNDELPVAALREEIETPGPGQVRGFIVQAGNPVLSWPGGEKLARSLAKLELMVSIDIYKSETAQLAHYILPPTFGLEHDHYPLLFSALAVRNSAKYSPPVLQAPAGSLDDHEILLGIASAVLRARGVAGRIAATALEKALGGKERPRQLLDLLLRTGSSANGQPLSMARLLANPHGIDLGPLAPRLSELLSTPTGRVNLVPQQLREDLERLGSDLLQSEAKGGGDELLLIGRRQLRSNNSWMHNSERLTRGENRCTLLVHPDDAERAGLRTGSTAAIRSPSGEVAAEVTVSDEIMPGVVSLPHGFGHAGQPSGLSVAARLPGPNANELTSEREVDTVSGTSVLQGVRVSLTAAPST